MEIVALYYRVSTEEQEFENQISQLQEYCRNNSYEYDLFGDPAETGTNFANRKDFIKLMELCGLEYSRDYNSFKIDKFKLKKYNKVICKSSSRFGRAVEVIPLLELLHKNNVSVIFLEDNATNDNILDPTQNLMLGLNSLINKQYSLQTSQRVKNGMLQSAKRGEILVNPNIYGFDYKNGKLYKNKDSKNIELIYILYSNNVGLRRIARILNNKGLTTTKGNAWNSEGIRTIIDNPKYCGINARNRYSLSKITKDTHPTKNSKDTWIIDEDSPYIEPIIPKELYYKCQNIKNSKVCNRRGKYRGLNPLVGKIVCGKCGKNYLKDQYDTKAGVEYYYKCSTKKFEGVKTCDNFNIKENTIKEIVTNEYISSCIFRYKHLIIQSLENKKTEIYNKSEADVEPLRFKIRALEDKISKLLNLYLDEKITKDIYDIKYKELNDNLSSSKKELKTILQTVEDRHREVNIINIRLNNTKNLSLDCNYTWEEIINDIIKKIVVNEDRTITITLNINNIDFEDTLKHQF